MIVWQLDLQLPVQSMPITTKVCQLLETSRWYSLGTPVSSTNKTDNDITEILLKVVTDMFHLS